MKRQGRAVLITNAERSHAEQLRSRQRRYVVMMLIRAACLVIAAILVTTGVPLRWLWVSLCGLAMVLIPWLAVITANDRPPREKHRLSNWLHREERGGQGPPALPPRPAGGPVDEPATHRTIDVDP